MKWPKVKIGMLGRVVTGKTPPTSDVDNFGGVFPFITPGDMHQGRTPLTCSRTISEKGALVIKNTRIPKGVVCVSCIGSDMGNVVYTDRDSFTNQQINSIVCKDGVDSLFVYYLMLTQKDIIKGIGTAGGTAVPIVSKSEFCDIDVPLPPLPVQQKIADILGAYDDLIENNRRRIELLEKMARELYRERFVRRCGKCRQFRLGDLIEVCYGKDHKALADGNIPVYGSGGVMRYAERALYSGEAVLIPRKGSLNNILYVNGDFWTVDTMFYAKPKIPNVAPFVYYYLSSIDMSQLNSGTAVPSMTTEVLNSMFIALPSDSELKVFSDIFTKMYGEMTLLKLQNRNLTKQRDRLLPRLMSGKLDVSKLVKEGVC